MIQALTASGHRLLGLDIRYYLEDDTFYEVPWSSSGTRKRLTEGWTHEMDVFRIDEIERPEDAVERRILITWE